MNIGYSSRLPYDDDYYPDQLTESTYSINYRINSDQIYNENRCRSKFGPRSGYMGHGVSVPTDLDYAEAQSLVDLESVFSNRNTKASKAKRGRVNPVNPIDSYKLYNSKTCDRTLDTIYSLDSHPRSNYRDMEMNRFENLPRNPQDHIFEDWSRNSRLEAIDNFVPDMPVLWPDLAGPKPIPDEQMEPCYYDCETKSKRCPNGWRKK